MKKKITTSVAGITPQWLDQSLPWLAGAGLAVGHIAMTSNCTLPQQGRCSTCGSCIISLAALVSWAMIKNTKNEHDSRKNNHFN